MEVKTSKLQDSIKGASIKWSPCTLPSALEGTHLDLTLLNFKVDLSTIAFSIGHNLNTSIVSSLFVDVTS